MGLNAQRQHTPATAAADLPQNVSGAMARWSSWPEIALRAQADGRSHERLRAEAGRLERRPDRGLRGDRSNAVIGLTASAIGNEIDDWCLVLEQTHFIPIRTFVNGRPSQLAVALVSAANLKRTPRQSQPGPVQVPISPCHSRWFNVMPQRNSGIGVSCLASAMPICARRAETNGPAQAAVRQANGKLVRPRRTQTSSPWCLARGPGTRLAASESFRDVRRHTREQSQAAPQAAEQWAIS